MLRQPSMHEPLRPARERLLWLPSLPENVPLFALPEPLPWVPRRRQTGQSHDGGANPNTGPQTGFIQMDQTEFELTYTRCLR